MNNLEEKESMRSVMCWFSVTPEQGTTHTRGTALQSNATTKVMCFRVLIFLSRSMPVCLRGLSLTKTLPAIQHPPTCTAQRMGRGTEWASERMTCLTNGPQVQTQVSGQLRSSDYRNLHVGDVPPSPCL